MSGPNYFLEYLKEEIHTIASGVALASAALISIPMGLGVGMIPLIGFIALDIIGLTHIATSSKYKDHVDRRNNDKNIKATIEQLYGEIKQRGGLSYINEISKTFNRLWGTVERLETIAKDDSHSFTESDLYRVKAAALQYLRLSVADLFIRQRMANFNEETVTKNIKLTELYIRDARDPREIAKLQQSLEKYKQLLISQKKISHQNVAVTAAMMSLPDQIEEIYQMSLVNRGEQGANQLSESLTKLRTIEEINLEMETEIGYDELNTIELSGKTMYNPGRFSNPSKKPISIKTGA